MSYMQIIERSLPKKQIVKKEHSEIVKEDLASFLKRWHIIARNIPKHHRNFTALLKKRQMDAKRFSENCQREVLYLSIVTLKSMTPFQCALVYALAEPFVFRSFYSFLV